MIILWANAKPSFLPFFVILTALTVSHHLHKTHDQTSDILVTWTPLYDFLAFLSKALLKYSTFCANTLLISTKHTMESLGRLNKLAGLNVNTGKICLFVLIHASLDLLCVFVVPTINNCAFLSQTEFSFSAYLFSKYLQQQPGYFKLHSAGSLIPCQSGKWPAVLASSPEF